MIAMIPQWQIGPVQVPEHGLFVGLGVLAAVIVFVHEARRRGAVRDGSTVRPALSCPFKEKAP